MRKLAEYTGEKGKPRCLERCTVTKAQGRVWQKAKRNKKQLNDKVLMKIRKM